MTISSRCGVYWRCEFPLYVHNLDDADQYMRSRFAEKTVHCWMRFKLPALLVLLATCSCTERAPTSEAEATQDRVSEAFELRIRADYDLAEQTLESELKERPASGKAWFELARLEFYLAGRTQDMTSAQEAIGKAVEFNPKSGVYHQWAARIAMYRGILMAHEQDMPAMAEQFGIAIQSAKEAVAIDPENHAARRLLVSLYGNNPPDLGGDVLLAEEQVEALEENSPIDGAAGRCEFSYKGKPDQKLEVWTKIAEEYNSDSRFHENLAKEYAQSGDTAKATEHADRAIELNPSSAHVLMELARIFALNRAANDAEQFANRYLNYEPAGPVSLRAWTWSALGKIQQMKGDTEAGATSGQKAAELDSQFWSTMTPPPRELFEAP